MLGQILDINCPKRKSYQIANMVPGIPNALPRLVKISDENAAVRTAQGSIEQIAGQRLSLDSVSKHNLYGVPTLVHLIW